MVIEIAIWEMRGGMGWDEMGNLWPIFCQSSRNVAPVGSAGEGEAVRRDGGVKFEKSPDLTAREIKVRVG